jgi:uridine kinase
MDGSVIRKLVAEAAVDRDLVLVGIGGFGCAGKSTLARQIPDAQVVATDAFWDGAGFALDRLKREVIDPLVAGEPAVFEAWDWAAAAPRGSTTVAPSGVVVVEGVCALHRDFRSAYALRVWVETDRPTRLARAIARDGEGARSTWLEKWMPREERYFAEDQPVAAADAILDGDGRRVDRSS